MNYIDLCINKAIISALVNEICGKMNFYCTYENILAVVVFFWLAKKKYSSSSKSFLNLLIWTLWVVDLAR